jgi:hypothetical protein
MYIKKYFLTPLGINTHNHVTGGGGIKIPNNNKTNTKFLASIWLTCHQQECTLEITPPGTKTITFVFARTQLHSSIAIKQDGEGQFVELDTDKYEAPKRHHKNKNKKNFPGKQKGPDENGLYRTYRIKLLEKSPDNGQLTTAEEGDTVPDGDISKIKQFLVEEEDGTWSMHFRRFGLSQSRTRVRANVNKIDSYIKKRRQKLLLKESAALPWYGILALIFGLLGFMLTCLVGQFWDELPIRQGGPGVRRSNTPSTSSRGAGSGSQSRTQRPTFVVDTGRPSKYPPGYRPQRVY